MYCISLSNQLTKTVLFTAKQVFILGSSLTDLVSLLCDANTHPILYHVGASPEIY